MSTDNPDNLELKYIDQRYDGVEAWVRFNDSEWIRLDFMLEYYLFRNVNLTKKYKGQFKDKEIVKQYSELFYTMLSEETSNGAKFDFKKYLDWKKNNQSDVNDALRLLNS